MNEKPDMKMPVLYGGIVIGAISSIPFVSFVNCFCCAGILFGGFLTAKFYHDNFPPGDPGFTSSDCLLAGFLAGVIGAVIAATVSAVITAMLGDVAGKFVIDFLRNSSIKIPEEALRKIEESLAEELTVVKFVKNLVFSVVLFGGFGLLGGLIGYSVYKPKGLTPMPPPPPAASV
ncbi:MAG TPA: hypothetical protein VMW43_07230 [Bacteroidota bacterium]|nr:hypothetical protein [Bacteroidota bacterium]